MLKQTRTKPLHFFLPLLFSLWLNSSFGQDSIVYLRPYIRIDGKAMKAYNEKYDYVNHAEYRIDSLYHFGLKEYKLARRSNLYKVENTPLKSYMEQLLKGSLSPTQTQKLVEATRLNPGERYILLTVAEPQIENSSKYKGSLSIIKSKLRPYSLDGFKQNLFLIDSKTMKIKRVKFRSAWSGMKGSRGRQFERNLKKLLK